MAPKHGSSATTPSPRAVTHISEAADTPETSIALEAIEDAFKPACVTNERAVAGEAKMAKEAQKRPRGLAIS